MPKIVVTGRFIGGPLFAPKQTEQDKTPKYGLTLVLDEGQETKLKAAVDQAVQEKWNGKQPPGTVNYALRKGDDEEFEHSFGRYYINPKAASIDKNGNETRPGTFLKQAGTIKEVSSKDGVIYPGCFVAVEVDVYAYDGDRAKQIKPGISVGLSKVLFLKDGPRLSTQTTADKAFADFESQVSTVDPDEVW